MSFWLVFGGGVAVGFLLAVLVFALTSIFSLIKSFGQESREEEEDQRIQREEITRLQEVRNKRAQIHVVA